MNHKTKNHIPSKRLSLDSIQKKRFKDYFKSAIKLLVTFWALYYLLHHIDTDLLLQLLKTSDLLWLFLAFVVFNASKIISSIRLNRYFRTIGILLSETNNLRLYYLGMFYNLFLPGGISGDGYKIYILAKRHNSSYSKLFGATLLDRISGLSALLFLAGILFALSSFAELSPILSFLAWFAVVLSIPASYIVTKKFFSTYLDIFSRTTLLAFAVQLLQLLSAIFIVWALPETDASMIDYLTLFLISSVIAVLPISIGGIGVRELTFFYGFGLIGGDTTVAVTFSLIFFIITALSSLIGIFVENNF